MASDSSRFFCAKGSVSLSFGVRLALGTKRKKRHPNQTDWGVLTLKHVQHCSTMAGQAMLHTFDPISVPNLSSVSQKLA